MSHTTTNPSKGSRGQKVAAVSPSSSRNTVASSAKDEVLISRIKRENQNIYQNLQMLESEERVVVQNKSEQLKQLAKNYEKLADLGEYTEPVNHICATIVRELTQRTMWASVSLARAVLPEKYKQTEFSSHNNNNNDDSLLQSPTSNDEALDLSVTPPAGTEDSWQQYAASQNYYSQLPSSSAASTLGGGFTSPVAAPDKSFEEMSDDEARQWAERLTADERKRREALLESRRRAREAREYCETHKIALSPEFEADREAHISAISQDSGPSEAWEACLEFEQTIKKLADKLYRWRPPAKLAKDLKLAFDEEIEFYKPFIDEKYRKSQPSWWVVQLHNIWHGKHAAAIMNATPISEQTKRALTREQVGDKYEEDLKRALRFVAAQKVKVKLWWWFVEMNEKGIAKRAKDLNPVLSEKSFT